MMKTMMAAGVLVALASPAFAISAVPAPDHGTLIQDVRADCRWVDNKWTYRRGDKVLVCRPDRPRGFGWTWYREGGREGWYHKNRREWHNRNW